jgi:protein-tyrosine phosphatase
LVQSAGDDRPFIKSYWVIPGQFLAGEYPGSIFEENAQHKVAKLLECGVNAFIDLTENSELLPYEPILRSLSQSCDTSPVYLQMPIQDFNIPSREGMIKILDTLDSVISQGRVVYLHCMGGVGRTGTVVGCYLVRHGMPADHALDEINRLRMVIPPGLRRNSPETPVQIALIKSWRQGE